MSAGLAFVFGGIGVELGLPTVPDSIGEPKRRSLSCQPFEPDSLGDLKDLVRGDGPKMGRNQAEIIPEHSVNELGRNFRNKRLCPGALDRYSKGLYIVFGYFP